VPAVAGLILAEKNRTWAQINNGDGVTLRSVWQPWPPVGTGSLMLMLNLL